MNVNDQLKKESWEQRAFHRANWGVLSTKSAEIIENAVARIRINFFDLRALLAR